MLRSALLLALALFSPGLAHGQLPFGGIVNVANTPGDSRHPHIAVDQGGTLHVAWADDSGSPGSYRILYKRSFDRGATFTSAVQVSQGAGAGLRPRLALHGSAVHLVWMEDVSDTKDILFARSVNGGASFAPPVNVSRTAGQSLEGRIGVGPTARSTSPGTRRSPGAGSRWPVRSTAASASSLPGSSSPPS